MAVLLILAAMVVSAYVVQSQWTPDGRNYTPMTLEYLGHSPAQARAMADAWFDARGASDRTIVPADFTADLYAPRVLYPLLSVPFVAVLGIPGMLVVPALSLLAFTVLMTWLLARLFTDVVAVATVALTLLGNAFLLYSTAALTDSLAMALMAAICCVLPIRPGLSRYAPMVLGVLVLVLGFTRQIAAVPAGMVLLVWLGTVWSQRRWRTTWAPYAVAAAVSVTASLAWVRLSSGLGPARSIVVLTGSENTSEALGKLPGELRRIASIELRTLLGERPLLLIAAAAVAFMIWRWRSPVAMLIAGGITTTAALQVASPYPTYGRILLPLLPILMVGAAGMISAGLTSAPGTRAGTIIRPRVPAAEADDGDESDLPARTG